MTVAKKSYHGAGYTRSYEVKSGTRWSYQLRVPVDPTNPNLGTRQVERGGFLTEKEADKALQKAQRDSARGLRIGSKVPTLREFSEQWLDSLDLAAATVAGYRRQFDRHVLPRIGDMTLDAITTTTLNTLYKQMQTEAPPSVEGRWSKPKPLGANSVLKIATTLGALFDSAVADKYLLDNPAKSDAIRRPSKQAVVSQAAEMTVWTAEQMTRFLTWDRDTKKDPDYPLWQLYAASGARRSEVLALRWSDIDLKTGKVHIRRTLDTGRPGETKKPKNGKARDFTVSPSTVSTLREWRRLLASRDLNLVRGDRWVFPMPGDWERHRNPQSTSEMFSRRVEWAQKDVGGADVLPTIHLHEVRHSAATILIENGTDPKTVAERLGHESVRITLDIYTHVTKQSDDRAASLLDFG
ncbi:phage integrase [Mycobacteroides abscessus subsp. massiliense]|uniref:tyrosine-type recombinase/integrase n=1 Tax=Mycobacteroides abscessus TaxID=36809 RepID=UPI0009A817EC|nr:site-specific integrase [Mycobacteroides abscessus]MDO3055612.1 tyrosine-type recombinase/integrase [Mycobacteroides abscessus subsp. massiliense]SLC37603.1 phage integrase [Mycobacteroides abscessus subsp. massiliense]SLH10672.1 phage integrase [Mycobacteroides abscessus subsp. massiliense]SLI03291.1 phage integrase [Mycobacteroides abscessus subsp. massiliense]